MVLVSKPRGWSVCSMSSSSILVSCSGLGATLGSVFKWLFLFFPWGVFVGVGGFAEGGVFGGVWMTGIDCWCWVLGVKE